jgi:glutamate synthase (NADPH/NADH) small chain
MHIIEEAKRCLQCKKPQCSNGCPVNTSVNEMIKLLLDKKVLEAGEMLFTNNPLSVICALICPHELQCEGLGFGIVLLPAIIKGLLNIFPE